ncbi:MAG TPA: MBL fold metallo-hydrolase [Bacteroidota bacterium]|nr:MBL fold metallo-hydrolase [Bacteroidota bacterium]
MIFRQFQHDPGACLSYLIGCPSHRVCVVIDPQIQTDIYTSFAAGQGMNIVRIIETHAHADHLSGAKLLSARTGAPVHFHDTATTAYPTLPLRDGDELAVGNALLRVLHTPGHTADSVSLLVSDLSRSRDPWMVLTGDTLFVGDTGRPDLDGSPEMLYDSIWGKLLSLPDGVEMFPGHAAGSSCGKAMSPKTSSTIGYERLCNPALRFRSKEEFVAYVLSDLPVQPPRFQQVRGYNLGAVAEPPIEKTYNVSSLQITVTELRERLARGERPFLLDVREEAEYRMANLGGTLIPMREIPARLSELEPSEEIIVHCHHGSRSQRVVDFLYEKGFRNVKNLVGGIDAWSVEIDQTVPRY